MAPLDPTNTARVFLDYETCGENHTAMLRYSALGSVSDCFDIWQTMLGSMNTFLHQITITGARNAVVGSNITNPVTWTGDATYGGDPGPHYASAQYIDFIGRDVQGRRVRSAFFGAAFLFDGTQDDFRFQAADFAFVVTCVTALEGDPGNAVTINGLAATWHLYGNGGVNAYWRNQIR